MANDVSTTWEVPQHYCPHCPKAFKTQKQLERHVKRHLQKAAREEDPAPVATDLKTQKQLDAHLARLIQPSKAEENSGLVAENPGSVAKYPGSSAPVAEDPAPALGAFAYACSQCPKTYKTKASLKRHENRHLGIMPSQCR